MTQPHQNQAYRRGNYGYPNPDAHPLFRGGKCNYGMFNYAKAMRRKVWLWIIFLSTLLLISLSATPFSKTADLAFVLIRFSIVIAVSILALREWWRTRNHPGGHHPGSTGTLLRRLRAWYYDEKR